LALPRLFQDVHLKNLFDILTQLEQRQHEYELRDMAERAAEVDQENLAHAANRGSLPPPIVTNVGIK